MTAKAAAKKVAVKVPAKRKASGKPKNKGGRPSKYTPALMATIGERMGNGEPLTHICRDLKLCDNTVRNWMEKDPEVAAAIARARESGRDSIAYRMRQTARGKGNDDGGDSTGDVQRDKLIIDTDLKLLAKWDPKRYGDKVQLSDSDGNNLPVPPQFIVVPVEPKAE